MPGLFSTYPRDSGPPTRFIDMGVESQDHRVRKRRVDKKVRAARKHGANKSLSVLTPA